MFLKLLYRVDVLNYIRYYFLLFSFSLVSFNSFQRRAIASSIKSQLGCEYCYNRVIDWYKPNYDERLLPGMSRLGVRAFHTYPLALTARLDRFLFAYHLSGQAFFRQDEVFSTPGIIWYKDESNRDVFKVVAFEATRSNNQVNHRSATTCPSNFSLRVSHYFTTLKNKLDEISEYMKKHSNLNPRFKYSDGSYLVLENSKEKWAIFKGPTCTIFAYLK